MTTISSSGRGLTLASYTISSSDGISMSRDGQHIKHWPGSTAVPIPELIAAACDDALHSSDRHAEDLTLRLDRSDLRLIFDGLQMLADTCRDEADRLGAYDESGEADDYLADADEARQLAELIARSTQAVLTPIDEDTETRHAA